MPVIRRFKPTIGGGGAAPTPTGVEHLPTSPVLGGPGPPAGHHSGHHHHHHHHESAAPVVAEKETSIQQQQQQQASNPVTSPNEQQRKRPTSISISVSHYSQISPANHPHPYQSPRLASPTAKTITLGVSEIGGTSVVSEAPPKIRRIHQDDDQDDGGSASAQQQHQQENLIIPDQHPQEKGPKSPMAPPPVPHRPRSVSPSCSSVSSSSRAPSPTPSQAMSTASATGGGGGRKMGKRRGGLLARPIELPKDVRVEELKMRDFLLFNPDGSPMRWRAQAAVVAEIEATAEAQVLQASDNSNIKDRLRNAMSPPPVPNPPQMGTPIRIRLGESGEAIINEESLVIDTTGPRPDPSAISKVGAIHEEMESTTTYTTYANYRRKGKVRGRRWSKEETARFFVALRCCGLDFSMISKFFPDREERELRSKFKAEDKRNADVVTRFLNGSGDDDMGTYDPLALLATSSAFSAEKKPDGDKVKKPQPTGTSKRGDGVPRGRGAKVRLAFGEDSVSSDSGEGSDGEDGGEEDLHLAPAKQPGKRKVIISESSTCSANDGGPRPQQPQAEAII